MKAAGDKLHALLGNKPACKVLGRAFVDSKCVCVKHLVLGTSLSCLTLEAGKNLPHVRFGFLNVFHFLDCLANFM